MRHIELTQGYVALVDDADFPAVSGYCWRVSLARGGYPYASATRRQEGRRTSWKLQRLLTDAQPGQIVKFRNGDSLDCRRENLWLTTMSEALSRRQNDRDSASRYKGVGPKGSRWMARITINSRCIYLGTHDSEEEAARAYDQAALQLRTDPVLNFDSRGGEL